MTDELVRPPAVGVPPTPTQGHDLRRLLRTHWPLLVLGFLAIAIPILARHTIFPAYSWNRDEPVYLWQMEGLRSGEITSTDGGFPDSFRPWLTAARDGELFSQYTLGWPLALLAADLVFGSPDAALALGALLAVLGTYALARELTGDRSLALVAAGLMIASPILAIQGGVYLSYLFTFGLGLLFAASLLSGVRRSISLRIVVAGLLLGWIFLTRPFDAVLWGVAVVGYLVLVRWREWRTLVRSGAWLSAGLFPVVAVTLAYNFRVTGSLTQFPINAADPLDTFGFGPRRIMPRLDKLDYDLGRAIQGSGLNALYLPVFLVGSYLGVAATAAGLWLRRRDRSTLVLLALMVVFPLGYFFFWGTRISSLTVKLSGPIYLVPLYAPVTILMATVVVTVWRNRRAAGVVLVAVLAAATIPFAVSRLSVNHRISEAQLPWKESSGSIDGRALVFGSRQTQYLLFLNPYASNGPDLDDRVLFATDRGGANLDLIEAMPDRTPYSQWASLPDEELLPEEHPRTPAVSVTRLRTARADVVTLRVRIRNRGGGRIAVAYLRVGSHVEKRVLSRRSREGAVHQTEWVVAAPGAAAGPPTGADEPVVRLRDRNGTVGVGAGFGGSAAVAAASPVARERFSYRVDGSSFEMLLPTERYRRGRVDGGLRRWFRVEEVTGFDVDVRPRRQAGG